MHQTRVVSRRELSDGVLEAQMLRRLLFLSYQAAQPTGIQAIVLTGGWSGTLKERL